MASITFIDTVTHVPAEWANDVDALVYDIFGGANTAPLARQNLGLGTLAVQNAANIQVAGGSIDGVVLGYTQPGVAKFQNVLLEQEPFNSKHAATKGYVDTIGNNLIQVINNFQASVPLSGNGTVGNPLALLAPNVMIPDPGALLLMKKTDGNYQSVPVSSIIPSTVINGVVTNTQVSNDLDTVPVWNAPGSPLGQELKNSALRVSLMGGLHTLIGTLPSGTALDAHDLQFDRTVSSATAQGQRSAILSGSNNSARTPESVILGGDSNVILADVVGNTRGLIGLGTNNSLSGTECAILLGYDNVITSSSPSVRSTHCIIGAGHLNIISDSTHSAILVGDNIFINGAGSVVVSGSNVSVSHSQVTVIQGFHVASRLDNSVIQSSSMLDAATSTGVLRRSVSMSFLMVAETSNGSTVFLTTKWPIQTQSSVYSPVNNVSGAFDIKMTAVSKDASVHWTWRAEGCIWRSAGILYLNYASDPVPPGYTISITTNTGAVEGLILNVTQSIGAQPIAWSAEVDLLETEIYGI